ncbi:MAG: hypothetical protein V3U66_00400, partial [Acidobacteriota bacterium]
EFIGLLADITPKRNMFLVRIDGEAIQKLGVAAGMSGSPVYLNGSLAGALAYSWSFSKQPIAGITPIGEMLDLLAPDASRAAAANPAPVPATDWNRLFSPEGILDFFDRYLSSRHARSTGRAVPLRSLPIPLTVSGLQLGAIPALQEELRMAGFLPIPAAGGAAAGNDTPAPKLEPGSAVAVKLIRGDVQVSALGTVTYTEGDRVLAFGHPFLNLGPTDLPMAAAEVQTIIPSLATSFKFGNPLEEVGVFEQDRTAGIAGRLGSVADLIPVRLDLTLPGGRVREYRFELIRTGYLTPYLLYMVLNGILNTEGRGFADPTVDIQEGSTILLQGQENIVLKNRFSGPISPYISAALPAFILHILMANEYEPAEISGINLRLRYDQEPHFARIERIWCDRGTVRPGESVTLSVALRPFREAGYTRTLEIEIPEEEPPGRILLQVGNGLELSHRDYGSRDSPPRDLPQLIRLINHLRSNDKVYVFLTRPGRETVIRGERFSHLPPSKASLLLEPQINEDILFLPERRILEDAIETDHVITGHRSLVLVVRQ